MEQRLASHLRYLRRRDLDAHGALVEVLRRVVEQQS
jgi:hypothetical protein